MYDIHNFYGPISISNLNESDLVKSSISTVSKGFKVQIKNKYEVPNFCMIFTIFMVLSQFQILLSLTQCSPVPLLYLNEYVGFKVQIKNKHEVPDFCMIFTIFMVLSQFQILLSLTQCSPVTLLYPNEDVGFF